MKREREEDEQESDEKEPATTRPRPASSSYDTTVTSSNGSSTRSESPEIDNNSIFNQDANDSLKNAEEDGSAEEEDIVRQTNVTWISPKGESYTASIKIQSDYEYDEVNVVTAKLFFEKKQVGKFKGTILKRPSSRFFEVAEYISDELKELSTMFCNSQGNANRIKTNLDEEGISSGGFFQMYVVSVNAAHKGQDVGLEFVHQILSYCKDLWTLAVMKPGILRESWKDRLGICHYKESNMISEEQEANMKLAQLKICRHFARLGFQQAGRCPGECDTWYLTRNTFSSMHTKWKSKQETIDLDVYVAPESHVVKGVDKDLVNLFYTEDNPIIPELRTFVDDHLPSLFEKIEELVKNQGASIHGARLYYMIVANPNVQRMDAYIKIMMKLHSLAPEAINSVDEFGNTPLHCAASVKNLKAMVFLIQHGAQRFVQNISGMTPLMVLERSRRDAEDTEEMYSLTAPKMPATIINYHCSAKLLMNDSLRRSLIDGWMSSRMHYMLKLTAESIVDLKECEPVTFEEAKPMPYSKCFKEIYGFVQFEHGFPRFEYIPTEIFLRNREGIPESFLSAWYMIWEAIMNLLRKRMSPSKTNIQNELGHASSNGTIQDFDMNKIQTFYTMGGKIDFAIDALINISKNTLIHGSDEWEYDIFKDDIDNMPATPFDDYFELARLKCLEITNDNYNVQPNGPYTHKGLSRRGNLTIPTSVDQQQLPPQCVIS